MSNKCSYEGCDREVYASKEKCIFHAEKDTEQEFRDFLSNFRGILGQYEHDMVQTWNFRGFVFPGKKQASEQSIHLGSTVYKGNVDFGRSIFRGEVSFGGATFQGNADFADVLFEGKANFKGVTFKRWAGFELATFLGGASFASSTFDSEAFFHRAKFKAHAWFWSTIFAETAQFEGSTFVGEVEFKWPGGPRRPPGKPLDQPIMPGTIHFKDIRYEHSGILNFSNNDLREGCRVIFEDCDLSRTKFVGTDCRKIDFKKCTWADCWSREGVGDEHLERFAGKNRVKRWLSIYNLHVRVGEADWRRIAVTYNELASNYSSNLDYPQAHHFDAGVMEMRRLDCVPERGWRKWLWDKGKLFKWFLAIQHRYISFIAFYGHLTGYGIRCLRPLLALVISVPFFAWLYRLTLEGNAAVSCWQNALKLALQIASVNRQGINVISDAGLLANIVAVAQLVVTATLITLFLFALRRRFKR